MKFEAASTDPVVADMPPSQGIIIMGAAAAVTLGYIGATVLWYRSSEEVRAFRSKYTSHSPSPGLDEDMSSGGPVKVIYGSESGNAESLAKDLVSALRERGVEASLVDPSQWPYMENYLRNATGAPLFASRSADGGEARQILLFIVATTGEGEPPANMISLYQELHATTQSPKLTAPFAHVHYAVFALGDSSYKYYCKAGITVNSALKKGGGVELERIGFGDARNGNVEDNFEDWQERLLQAMVSKAGVVFAPVTLSPPEPHLAYTWMAAEDASASSVPYPTSPPFLVPSQHFPTPLPLIKKEMLTKARESDGSVIVRCTFSIKGTGVAYQAGDHLGLYPANSPSTVDRLVKILGIPPADLNTPMELRQPMGTRSRPIMRNVFPSRVTLRTALSYYVGLDAKPKRSTLRTLARYCTDVAERDTFLGGITPPKSDGDGSVDTDTSQKRAVEDSTTTCTLRTVLDYMEKFPSCQCIPLGHLLEILPRIKPRYYSIASDHLSHPEEVVIYVRAVCGGLASDFLLNRMQLGDTAFSYVRTSNFHLSPRQVHSPMLLIGPGTGVAALVGLCYRRESLMRKQPSATYGPCRFYFGAQSKKTEYFVREELERWALDPLELERWDQSHPRSASGAAASSGGNQDCVLPHAVITSLRCAFSRDQPEKVYVTHLLYEDKDTIYEMLMDKSCLVYVSGDAAAMAKDLDRALITILQEKGKMARLAALEHIRVMEGERRFLKDVY